MAWSVFFGIIFGGAITIVVAHCYYKITSSEFNKKTEKLDKEIERLRCLVKFLGYELDKEGHINLPKDESGKATYNQTLKPKGIPSGEQFGKPVVENNKK